MKQKDTYGEPTIIVTGNVIAKVYRPILTPEERERRMQIIIKTASDLLREK